MATMTPEYVELEGWADDVREARTLGELPQAARKLIALVEAHLQVTVEMVSVGPGRKETIHVGEKQA